MLVLWHSILVGHLKLVKLKVHSRSYDMASKILMGQQVDTNYDNFGLYQFFEKNDPIFFCILNSNDKK